MPEVISKHPEITIRVLEDAGARCGPEFQPRILTRCPGERFCSLPTGEICVFGIDEIPQMTQISREELLAVVLEEPLPLPLVAPEPVKAPVYFDLFGIVIGIVMGLILGLVIGKIFLSGKKEK
jgi:hypothetical protein